MIDTEELLKKIMSVKNITDEQARRIVEIVNERLKDQPRPEEEKLYTDEPIDPQQLRKPRVRVQTNDNAIERIAAMRRIQFDPANKGKTQDEIFFLQTQFMADFDDDYVPAVGTHADFSRSEYGLYFFGFNRMPTNSIRAYYTWRTKIRNGQTTRTELRNALIYMMELINCIGFASAEEAYAALCDFIEKYERIDCRIKNFGAKWLRDFMIFYGLKPEIPAEKNETSECIEKLSEPQNTSDDELFLLLAANASYAVDSSRFYKLYPEMTAAVVCKVFRAVMAQKPEESLLRYVCSYSRMSYELFNGAMFAGRSSRLEYSYEVSPTLRYICSDGKWYVETKTRSKKHTAELGKLLKNTECLLRKRMKFSSQLKPPDIPAELIAVIKCEINSYMDELVEIERQKISFDLTKLDSIRNSAEETAGLLLVENNDEGMDQESAPEQIENAIPNIATEPEPAAESEFFDTETAAGIPELTEAEKTLLKCLVSGADYREALRRLSTLPSIAADSLNEKLFDIFLDNVIADNGSELEIIEDYLEELKGIAD